MKKVSEMKSVIDLLCLKGKVALVTGAASGIGQAMCVALAEAGANVAGTWNRKPIDETKSAVESTGKKFVPIQVNLGDAAHDAAIIDKTVDHFGRLDILVNNAAIIDHIPLEERSYESYKRIIDVNLNSAYVLSRTAALYMKQNKIKGRIINIGSIAGVSAGGLHVGPYTIAKHGMFGITQQLAYYFAPDGITFNEICPGVIDTPIHDGTPVNIKDYISYIPVGRLGDPEDFKGMVVFFASEASSFTTGQQVIVDGGMLLS